MPGTEGLDDTLLALVSECLDRLEAEGASAVDAMCVAHPQHAERLRSLIARLRDSGMLPVDPVDSTVVVGAAPTPAASLDPSFPDARFRVDGEVGRGGMGAVLKVFDRGLRRHLAMKVALVSGTDATDSADRRLARRFLEEAQVTGQLEHPGIVPVHELGVDAQGRRFFTMRLVQGETFRDVIDHVHTGSADWSLTRALGVLQRVCDAMAFAHEKGVLHRDLKPANVMVGRFGETYVMDWGLARVLGRGGGADIRLRDPASRVRTDRDEDASADSPLVTMDGDVVGTPAYMALEQAQGRVDELGPQADVYSVGAMLYHLLCGHMPYVPVGNKASPRTVLAMVLQGPPPQIDAVATGVDPELASICAKAMARLPVDRYADMSGLSDDLRAYLELRVVKAHASGPWPELRKWMRRNQALSAISGMALVAVVGLALWAWFERRAAIDSATDASRSESLMREQRDRAVRAEAEAQRNAHRTSYHAALMAFELGDPRAAALQLDALPIDPADRERPFLDLQLDRSRLRIGGAGSPIAAVAYCDDGGRIAVGGSDGALRVVEADTGADLLALPAPADRQGIVALAWNAAGTRLAAGFADRAARIWDAASGAELRTVQPGDDALAWLGFAHDDALLTGTRDGIVRRHVAGADPAVVARRIGRSAVQPVLSPGRDRLLFARASGLSSVDLRGSQDEHAVFDRENDAVAVALDVVRGQVAAATAAGQVRLYDVESGRLEQTIATGVGGVTAIAFRPGDRVLVMAGADGLVRFDLTGQRRGQGWIGLRGSPTAMSFSPDGADLAIGSDDGVTRVFAAGSAVSTVLDLDVDRIDLAAFSADGEWLACAAVLEGVGEHPLLVVEVATGALRAMPQVHVAAITAIAFQSQGRYVASGAKDGVVRVGGIDGTGQSFTFRIGGAVDSLAWVGEDRLLVAGAERLEAFHLGRAAASRAVPGALPPVASAGTSVVALAEGRTALVRLDPDTLAVSERLEGLSAAAVALAVSADGSRVAAALADGAVLVWDVASRGITYESNLGPPLRSLSFGSAATRLACSRPGQVMVLDLLGGDATFAWNALLGADRASDLLLFNPAGSVALCAGRSTARLFLADRRLAERLWDGVDRRERVARVIGSLIDPPGDRLAVQARVRAEAPAELLAAAIERIEASNPLARACVIAAWQQFDPDRGRIDLDVGRVLAERAVRADPFAADARLLLNYAGVLGGAPPGTATDLIDSPMRGALEQLAASIAAVPFDVSGRAGSVAEQGHRRGLRGAFDLLRTANLRAVRRHDRQAETIWSRAERRHAAAGEVFERPATDGDVATAIQAAEEAVGLIPWNAEYRHRLARLQHRAGNWTAAHANFGAADRLNRESPLAYDRLRDLAGQALCLARLGSGGALALVLDQIGAPPRPAADAQIEAALRELDDLLRTFGRPAGG